MSKIPKSMLWVLAGIVIGLLALTSLGGQALAQSPPPTSPEGFASVQDMGSAHFSLNWNVIGNGGGQSSSAHFTVNSTIGQPTVGLADSDHFEVCSGYWCWVERLAGIFLPLITKP